MSIAIKEKSPFSSEDVTAEVLPVIQPPVAKRGAEKTEYRRIKFHSKSDKNQTDDIILSLNGETLLIQRDKEIVLPESFLRVADEATYNQYKAGTGSRKVASRVRLYPYDMIGNATEKEFFAQRADGTRRQAEARTRDEALQAIR